MKHPHVLLPLCISMCLALPDTPSSYIIDSALDLQPPHALATDTTTSSATSCMEQAMESGPVHESATCIPSSLVEDSSLRDNPKSGMK